MARIFLVRHGETEDNKNHIFSGWRESDLTPQGVEEVKQIAEKLKNEKITKAYESDQVRSKHTLEIILAGHLEKVEVVTDPRIKERDYGGLTGKNKDEVDMQNPAQYKLWHRSYDVTPPNGESLKDVEKRVLEFLRDEMPKWEKADVILISAHGNSLRPIRRFFENMTEDEMASFEHTPGKIYQYQI